MTATLRSVATNTESGASSSFTVTTGVAQVGDILVAFAVNDFYLQSNIQTPTGGPGGWTAVTNGAADGGTNEGHVKAFVSSAVASSGAQTITFSETGTTDEEKAGVVFVVAGADTSTPIDTAQGSTSTTNVQASWVATGVSPTSSDALLLAVWTAGGGAAPASYTLSGGSIVEQTEFRVGGISGVVGSEALSASGATGTRTATPFAPATWSAVLVAVKAGSAAVAAQLPFMRPPGRKSPAGRLAPLFRDAAVSAQVDASPTAGTAAATGAALDATVNVQPNAGNAAGTGAANAATVSVAPAAGNAAGTGTANTPTPNVAPTAGNVAGTGSANQPTVTTAPNVSAGTAAGTGAAQSSSITASGTAAAGVAAGTGAANTPQPQVSTLPGAATATGTGQTPQAAVSANAAAGAGSGAAQTPQPNVQPSAGAATGAGAALDPAVTAVSTARAVIIVVTQRRAPAFDSPGQIMVFGAPTEISPSTASAGVAAGTGSANTPTVAVQPNAGNAPGSGVAPAPAVRVSTSAGAAVGTGAAGVPSAGLAAAAGPATGVGAARDANVAVAAQPGVAAGVGAARDATTSTSSPGNAGATTAQGVGAANNPTITTSPSVPAGNADAAGAAQTPTVAVAANTAAAAAAGAARSPAVAAAVPAGSAAAAGACVNPSATATVSAGTATAGGVALPVAAPLSASPPAGLGGGTVPPSSVAVKVNAGSAAAAGSAYDPSIAGAATNDTVSLGATVGVGAAYGPRVIVSVSVRPGIALGRGATGHVRTATGGHTIRPSHPGPASTRPRDRAVLVRPTAPGGGPYIQATST